MSIKRFESEQGMSLLNEELGRQALIVPTGPGSWQVCFLFSDKGMVDRYQDYEDKDTAIREAEEWCNAGSVKAESFWGALDGQWGVGKGWGDLTEN